jgi:hypothetical protein
MDRKQGWIIISLLAALLLCDIAAAFRLQTAVDRVESAAKRLEEHVVLQAATVYVHGQALDDATDLPVAGFMAELYYNGRRLGASTSNASGYFGISTNVQVGEFELRFYAPATHPRVVQVLRAPNVTDFRLSSDLLSCTFRVSPAGGQTGNFLVFCAVAPTVGTLVPTAMPTATLLPTPVTPSPTWTPGPTAMPEPTATLCFRDPPPHLVEAIKDQFSALFPPPDNELTRLGFELAAGWPMLQKTLEVDGQMFVGQVWTPVTVVVAWPDGCFSIVDAWSFWHNAP